MENYNKQEFFHTNNLQKIEEEKSSEVNNNKEIKLFEFQDSSFKNNKDLLLSKFL